MPTNGRPIASPTSSLLTGFPISRRTVTRHLSALGLNRRKFIDPNGQTNRELRTSAVRRPGRMVHVDVKKAGRTPDGGGWRIHGRGSQEAKAVARRKRKSERGGYMPLHSAIDGYSGLAYTEDLSDEKTATAIAFLHRARAWLAAHGITHIERVVTDNGACYRADAFARALLGSRQQRITPYTPRHNGKVERYNRILSEEFLYACAWASEDQRRDALAIWNIHYNFHRPHSAPMDEPLGPLLPVTVLGRPSLCRRRLIDGIRWRVRTGAPWRDLPPEYGRGRRSMGSSAAGSAMVSGRRC